MDKELRFATEADIPALIELVNAAFQVEKFFKIGERTDENEVRKCFETGRFLILEDRSGMTGSIYVEVRGDRGYMGLLAVSPLQQRQGIGSRLMAAGEEFCREMGCHAVDISMVDLRTELPPLYERFGYRITGTAPFPADIMPVGIPCTFITMSKPLGTSA